MTNPEHAVTESYRNESYCRKVIMDANETKIDINYIHGLQKLIVFGYIRKSEEHSVVPQDIYHLVFSYYIKEYIQMIEANNPSDQLPIFKTNNHTFFYELYALKRRSTSEESGRAFASDISAIYHSNKPIPCTGHMFEWNLQCIRYAINDQIGIISTLQPLQSMRYLFDIRSTEVLCYYWWGDLGVRVNNDDPFESEDELEDEAGPNELNNLDNPDWKWGDRIGIRVDTNKWTLQFIKNGKAMYKEIELQHNGKDTVFYPVLRTDGNGKYKYFL